jgi:hypothetical protein
LDFRTRASRSKSPKVATTPWANGERWREAATVCRNSRLGLEGDDRSSIFVAKLEFCREVRFWRQKPQVASIVELANGANRDGTNDRSGVRFVGLPSLLSANAYLADMDKMDKTRDWRVPVAMLSLAGQRE